MTIHHIKGFAIGTILALTFGLMSGNITAGLVLLNIF